MKSVSADAVAPGASRQRILLRDEGHRAMKRGIEACELFYGRLPPFERIDECQSLRHVRPIDRFETTKIGEKGRRDSFGLGVLGAPMHHPMSDCDRVTRRLALDLTE